MRDTQEAALAHIKEAVRKRQQARVTRAAKFTQVYPDNSSRTEHIELSNKTAVVTASTAYSREVAPPLAHALPNPPAVDPGPVLGGLMRPLLKALLLGSPWQEGGGTGN